MLKPVLCWFWRRLSPPPDNCISCHKVDPLCACCEMDLLCEQERTAPRGFVAASEQAGLTGPQALDNA